MAVSLWPFPFVCGPLCLMTLRLFTVLVSRLLRVPSSLSLPCVLPYHVFWFYSQFLCILGAQRVWGLSLMGILCVHLFRLHVSGFSSRTFLGILTYGITCLPWPCFRVWSGPLFGIDWLVWRLLAVCLMCCGPFRLGDSCLVLVWVTLFSQVVLAESPRLTSGICRCLDSRTFFWYPSLWRPLLGLYLSCL